MNEFLKPLPFILIGFGLGVLVMYLSLRSSFKLVDEMLEQLKEMIKRNESLLNNETKD